MEKGNIHVNFLKFTFSLVQIFVKILSFTHILPLIDGDANYATQRVFNTNI